MIETKECEACGRPLFKRARDSKAQWAGRKFCSLSCRNKSTKPIPPHIRFWQFVNKETANGCWPWIGSVDGAGYGTLSTGVELSPMKAHRVSYEMRNGPIPEGMDICHRCDNPPCVNPDHLFIGTPKDNMEDMVRKGRMNPKSLLNLRPGQKGIHGAGKKSKQEIIHGTRS